ncbi:MAG: hypothetical protein HQL79_07495 [Magnetococcales bacterium]|nr:hypothetical protein [Magnetococcales bacterium]
MALKWQKRIVLAKVETTYGVDVSPVGADAILARDLTITPMAGETVKRGLIKPTLGNEPEIHVGTHVEVSLTVELAGAGTAGSVPGWGVLLQGCGFEETVSTGVDCQYKPVSSNEKSLTLYFHVDGQKHALTGCRGSVKVNVDSKKAPGLEFKFLGLWVDPATVADPTPDFTRFQAPLPVSKANTPTLTIHGYSAVAYALDIDMAVKVVHQDLINYRGVDILDRAPAGSLKIQAPALSTKNFFAIAKAETLGALEFEHGTSSGNVVHIACPKVQLLKPGYAEQDGATVLNLGLALMATDAGNDEITITSK